MLFNSYAFVFAFLPLVLYLWWHPRGNLSTRLALLTAASYFFYGWWDCRFVGLLAVSTLVDYFAGQRMFHARSRMIRHVALSVSLATNLGLLAFFKYSGFFARSLNAVAQAVHGAQPLPVWDIVLPVGISFYTFQTMSYTIDIYRGQAKPADSLLHFAAYVSMFPQLIAGPIVRYGQLEGQLRRVRHKPDWDLMPRGCYFFVMGLAQKLLLADVIAAKIDPLFVEFSQLQLFGAWFAMLGYSGPTVFRFRRLQQYGRWPWIAVGVSVSPEFRFTLQGTEHLAVLAALAHDSFRVAARLPVCAAWRQPTRTLVDTA